MTAVADVGSNTVHLLVARVNEAGCHRVLDVPEALRLGDVVNWTGEIGPLRPKLVRTVRALRRLARREGADRLVVVGTEPLRRAADAAAVVRALADEAGVEVRILEHEEEGLLSAIGVTWTERPAADVLVVDVGGGSTECVLLEPGREPEVWAAKVGGGRLTDRYLRTEPPATDEVVALFRAAQLAIDDMPAARPSAVIASGGGARALAKALRANPLTLDALGAARRELIHGPSARFAAAHAIAEWRARNSLAVVAILEALAARYGQDAIEVSPYGIRQGLAIAVAAAGVAWPEALRTLAARAVESRAVAI